jgi:hypothetical protein
MDPGTGPPGTGKGPRRDGGFSRKPPGRPEGLPSLKRRASQRAGQKRHAAPSNRLRMRGVMSRHSSLLPMDSRPAKRRRYSNVRNNHAETLSRAPAVLTSPSTDERKGRRCRLLRRFGYTADGEPLQSFAHYVEIEQPEPCAELSCRRSAQRIRERRSEIPIYDGPVTQVRIAPPPFYKLSRKNAGLAATHKVISQAKPAAVTRHGQRRVRRKRHDHRIPRL